MAKKKLTVAPGIYDGTWTVDGHQLRGRVDLRAGRPPVGWVVDASASPVSGDLPSKAEPVEVLPGVLDCGPEAVLLDAQVQRRVPGRARLTARLALVGSRVPPDALFDVVEFQVGGLTTLATVPPLREVRMPDTWDGEAVFGARRNPDADQRWHDGDGDEVELKFTVGSDHHDAYGMTVTCSPVMRVRGRPRTAGDWLREYVIPMAELTTLATCQGQRVAWVRVGDTGDEDRSATQVFGAEVETQVAFDATAADEAPGNPSLIPLGRPDEVDLAAVIARWRELRTQHPTFHHYLVLPRSDPRISLRAELMTAVPALEALHDQWYGKPPPDPGVHRRNDVLGRVRTAFDQLQDRSPLATEDLAFLKQCLPPTDSSSLGVRLRALTERSVGTELRTLLAPRLDPLPEELTLEGIDRPQTAWEAMATVRNRLGHGKTRVPTERQMFAVVRFARTLAVGMALSWLHVPDRVLRQGLEDGWWQPL